MNYVLSASRLMKANEVKELCQKSRKHPWVLAQQETLAKLKLYQIVSKKEKAVS